jgi:hypothetical protein
MQGRAEQKTSTGIRVFFSSLAFVATWFLEWSLFHVFDLNGLFQNSLQLRFRITIPAFDRILAL